MSRVKILFEDEALVVADKPPGLLTVATPKKEKYTLSSLLHAYPAHRLDRETSGVILLAKSKEIQQALADAFRARKVKKRYLAFVQGKLKQKIGAIAHQVQDTPYAQAKPALTHYRVLEEKEGFSIVEVTPITGRTNQIRIHFKQIGHPLVGERRFAFAKDFPIKFRRAALHASDIEFTHPVDGKKMCFHSTLADDMQEFLNTH